MLGYEQSKHMEVVQFTEEQPVIHLPHHYISRPTSTFTKLKVEFDGSASVVVGRLLEILYCGCKLKRNIVDILTMFLFPHFFFQC